MLVLTRKVDGEIYIGDEIRILVVAIHGDKVRLGIAVREGVSVHRREYWEKLFGAVNSEDETAF